MKDIQLLKDLIQFYIAAEKLKTTLRHSYTSDLSRKESSAEHSWMLGLIAITLFEHLPTKINQLKVIKLVLIHDLAESVTGDIPSFEISQRQKNKKKTEKEALVALTKNLRKKTRQEILNLWSEYEENKSPEAKVAQSLDKMEAVMQHNIFDISLWDQNDYDIHPYYKFEYFNWNPFLMALRTEIEDMSRKKITAANTLYLLKKKHRKMYQELNEKDSKD